MKSRFARFSIVLVPVMAVLASLAPPAHSVVIGGLAISGFAQVSNGIAYPCLGGKTTPPTVDVNKCGLPDELGGTNTNSAGFTLEATGVGGIVKVAKAKCGGAPVCADVGTFTVRASGRVDGACGLSVGSGAGTITQTAGVNGKPGSTDSYTFGFTGLGGVLIIDGTYRTSGTIVGAVLAVPDPTNGSTCANKSAKRFIVAGAVAVFDPRGPI